MIQSIEELINEMDELDQDIASWQAWDRALSKRSNQPDDGADDAEDHKDSD